LIKQDRLLRQPFQPSLVADAGFDGQRAGVFRGAIDFLRRLGIGEDRCAITDRNRHLDPVATDQATAGVGKGRFRRFAGWRAGQQDPHRGILAQPLEPRLTAGIGDERNGSPPAGGSFYELPAGLGVGFAQGL
jgi:hypothetical protein